MTPPCRGRIAHWFRNDLRVADNPGLAAACGQGAAVVGLYCLCLAQMRQHKEGERKLNFLLANLGSLANELKQLNIPLVVIDCDTYEQLPVKLAHVADDLQLDAIYCNREYAINENRRDRQVAAQLALGGVELKPFIDQSLLAPEQILNGQGRPYQVFTAFKNACERELTGHPPQPCLSPKKRPPWMGDDLTALHAHQALFPLEHRIIHPQGVGEAAAGKQLRQFLGSQLTGYAQGRDTPSLMATSQLSAFLAIGVLSVKQCWLAAEVAGLTDPCVNPADHLAWRNQLLWRDFYRYVMWHYPRVCREQPFQTWTDNINWRTDPSDFRRWCQGRTGFPLVDAGMRQLNHSGWMHNRLRMICASFLSKNLLIDWRLGQAYFMEQLTDGDFANNSGGWQWAASVGTDAAPYFRVFNPLAQEAKWDPQGVYIKRWLPELRGPAVADYPSPMVDLHRSRQRAIEVFKQAKSTA